MEQEQNSAEQKEKEQEARTEQEYSGMDVDEEAGQEALKNQSDLDQDKKFKGDRSGKEEDRSKGKDVKCYNCQGFGHMARECSKPQSGGKGRK